jgi:hypothetical protein
VRRWQAVLALCLLLPGCGAGHRPSAAPTPSPSATASPTVAPTVTTTASRTSGNDDNRVWVEGDSVLLGTTQTLPAALKGWRVTMDSVGSRRLTQAIPVLRANRSRIGAVLVVQMGNNYIPGEDGTFTAQIDRAMRLLAGVHRVVWVTVAEKWPNRVAVNRAIRAAAARWPMIRIADWAPVIASHRGYAYDMLHLTPAGRAAMARLIATAVGPAPPSTR